MKRRRFTQLAAGGVVAVPVVALMGSRAQADDAPMVDPESATAKALQYVAETDKEQKCSGCVLYQGAADDAKGLCSIFPGQSVPASAWCSAFQPKPA